MRRAVARHQLRYEEERKRKREEKAAAARIASRRPPGMASLDEEVLDIRTKVLKPGPPCSRRGQRAADAPRPRGAASPPRRKARRHRVAFGGDAS